MKKRNTKSFHDLINKVHLMDAKELLAQIPDNSIDAVITDPPYFLDKLDNSWNHEKISEEKNYCKVVTSLPPGMKFDKEQGNKFYNWYYDISIEILRVLKPGGFFFSFSSPRLYHKMTCAIDDAGFLIRDALLWIYTQNQPKAMSLNHFIDKSNLPDEKKSNLKKQLNGWKTPQLKSCYEPIAMAQKPTDGTFLENFLNYQTSLINTSAEVGIQENMFPSNILTDELFFNEMDKYFLVPKPTKKEKGTFNTHKTVKPISICEHLIKLSTYSSSSIVLDPFAGSGTTLVAAKKLNRQFIGCDINKEYIQIANKRLQYASSSPSAQSAQSEGLFGTIEV